MPTAASRHASPFPGRPPGDAGRPPADTRARLDAIFRAVTLKRPKEQGGGRGTWAQLPPEHGKPDTVSRTYRRWARANLWARLLAAVACPLAPPALRGPGTAGCTGVWMGDCSASSSSSRSVAPAARWASPSTSDSAAIAPATMVA